MNPALFLVAALALCALPSALGLTCYHCMGSLAEQKLCSQMSEYTNQTCMGADAKCATTEIKSNISDVKAFVLGCVNEPHNCTTYGTSLCANVTAVAGVANLTIELCNTECCNTSFCTADFLPTTVAPTDSTTATGTTVEATTAASRVFRPELIGMLAMVLMAVFFGIQ